MNKHRLYIFLFFLIVALIPIGCLQTESLSKGTLSGSVVDSAGNYLSGVRVSVPSASTITDIDGNWILENLDSQILSVTADREGFESQTISVEVKSGQTVGNVNFTLAEKGSIYGLTISEITSSQAIVSFFTRDSSYSYVEYGLNNLYGYRTQTNATPTVSHRATIATLTPSTTYHVSAVVTDSKGRTIRSPDKTFTTLFTRRGDPPQNLSAAKDLYSDAVVISWTADTGADLAGYLVYRAYSQSGPFQLVDSNPIISTSYTDTQVAPGEKVYYLATRLAGTGEESSASEIVSYLLPGITRGNLVWTPSMNPIYLSSDLTIRQDTSLTILAGTHVLVASYDAYDISETSDKKIDLKVQGALIVQATLENLVTFSPFVASPKPGQWNGISFDAISNLSHSQIRGLGISFARDGIQGLYGIPNIIDSNFAQCSESAIECRSARNPIVIQNVTVNTCHSGFLIMSNPSQSVQIASCTSIRCYYGIVSRDNGRSDVQQNTIQFSSLSGIDVGNSSALSRVWKNVVGPGGNGSGIIARGNDEIRRNTLQCKIGVEIRDSAQAKIRSNLILSDTRRGDIGVLYNGTSPYSTASQTIQSNDIWDQSVAALRYRDQNGTALTGVSTDLRLDPGLEGGNPFIEFPNASYSYRPSPGSALKGSGYGGEDIGAYDAP